MNGIVFTIVNVGSCVRNCEEACVSLLQVLVSVDKYQRCEKSRRRSKKNVVDKRKRKRREEVVK